MTFNISIFKQFMELLASKSGALLRDYYEQNLALQEKEDQSIVTVADQNTEELMRSLIRQKFPDHGIIGEEHGSENVNAEFVWTLDPIDGTVSFTHHCPLFGTLIGLLYRGEPILGCIHQPILNQLCIGDGELTLVNRKPTKMRQTTRLSEATLLITDIMHVAKFQQVDTFHQLTKQVKFVRTWGDCNGYLMVVSGQADIMLDPILHPWDILPLIPIIRGAGGVITTWSGENPITGKSCVVSNNFLHGAIIKMLNSNSYSRGFLEASP